MSRWGLQTHHIQPCLICTNAPEAWVCQDWAHRSFKPFACMEGFSLPPIEENSRVRERHAHMKDSTVEEEGDEAHEYGLH